MPRTGVSILEAATPRDMNGNDLPVEMMHKVMERLEAEGGLKAVCPLRQVSKAWLAAFNLYPGTAACKVKEITDLENLSKVVPGIGSLTAECRCLGYFRLDGLAQLTQLTSVKLIGRLTGGSDYEGYDRVLEPLAMLNCLPALLQTLETEYIYMAPQCFKYIQCTGLTQLSLHWTQNKAEDVAWLLENLPQLKVIVCLCILGKMCILRGYSFCKVNGIVN